MTGITYMMGLSRSRSVCSIECFKQDIIYENDFISFKEAEDGYGIVL